MHSSAEVRIENRGGGDAGMRVRQTRENARPALVVGKLNHAFVALIVDAAIASLLQGDDALPFRGGRREKASMGTIQKCHGNIVVSI